MTTPTPRPGILDIAPYVPGSSSAPGAARIYKLSSNESALGASPKAIAAYDGRRGDLFLYPDGSATALRNKIAETYGLEAGRIVCGAGSDEILQLLTRAYAGPGDNIVQSDHGFLVYALAAKSCGADVIFAPERDLATDVDAMLDAVTDKTRIVFVANPNNPTGTYISSGELQRLRDGLRDDVILVIDSAYAEYMDEADYDAGAALVDANDNVVMTRTFSKIYGLAGLRLGWGYFPAAIADVINRIRGPFNVNAAAIAAGIAALEDQAFVAANRAFNASERARMASAIDALGYRQVESFGNFILMQFPGEGGAGASKAQGFFRERGVIVREMAAYKLADWLRVSVGPEDANDAFLSALREFTDLG